MRPRPISFQPPLRQQTYFQQMRTLACLRRERFLSQLALPRISLALPRAVRTSTQCLGTSELFLFQEHCHSPTSPLSQAASSPTPPQQSQAAFSQCRAERQQRTSRQAAPATSASDNSQTRAAPPQSQAGRDSQSAHPNSCFSREAATSASGRLLPPQHSVLWEVATSPPAWASAS